MIRVLVTGATGQLGQCLKMAHKDQADIWDFLSREQLDLSKSNQISTVLNSFISAQKASAKGPYTHLIHTAAYTQVDAAETDKALAFEINEKATEALAKLCAAQGICMIYISTDFVFSQTSKRPWRPQDPIAPKGVYAQSKAAGEAAVAAHCPAHYIVRTSWLYSHLGHNFVKTMLRLSQQQPLLKVVADQEGTPTSALDLAVVIGLLIRQPAIPFGVHHFSNTGATTWAGFAREIFKQTKQDTQVKGINTQAFGAPAPRPSYSVLENSLPFENRPWEAALSQVLDLLKQ